MQRDANQNRVRHRLMGLDLIKFFSFLAIFSFHVFYGLWASSGEASVLGYGQLTRAMEFYSRCISFSGQSIIFLTFFLMAKKGINASNKPWLPIALLIFSVVINLFLGEDEPVSFAWDIYPLLFLSIVLLKGVDRFSEKFTFALGTFGFALTLFPWWNLENRFDLPIGVEQVLWGVCQGGADLADWPILPWLGFILASYAAGKYYFHSLADQRGLYRLSRGELLAWIAILLPSLFFWGYYFNIPIGWHYACAAFRAEPLVFYAHMIFVFFFTRLSLVPAIDKRLHESQPIQWLGRLGIVKHFWLAYFLHLTLSLGVGLIYQEYGWQHSAVMTDVFLVGGILSVELLLQIFMHSGFYQKKFRN